MEHKNILKLLNERSDCKFATRKWNIANDHSNANYDVGNEIICKKEVLKSNLRHYNDVYILVRSDIITTAHHIATWETFKNCAQFTKRIKNVDGTAIDNSEDLDLVMPMYNLRECSSNCSDKTGSLWFYSKDEANNFDADTVNNNAFKFFEYRAELWENTIADRNNPILKNATITVPLKYPSKFRQSFEMPLINCKVKLKLRWTKHCVLASTAVKIDNADSNDIIFTIKHAKLYVHVVTLSAKDNQKWSKLLSKGFERSVYWNE